MNQQRAGGGFIYLPINTTTLEQLGVKLLRDGNRLRVKAPAGVITPALRAWLAENKDSLIATLQSAAWDAADWQAFYDEADPALKQILEESNFNPCRGEINLFA